MLREWRRMLRRRLCGGPVSRVLPVRRLHTYIYLRTTAVRERLRLSARPQR